MDTGGKTARSDLIGGAGWIVFGLLILAEALRMDRFTSMGATLYTMPGFMPGVLGSVIALLGLVLLLRGARRMARERQATAAGAQADEASGAPAALFNARMALAVPLTLVYAAVLLGRVPFWLATSLFIAAFTWVFMPPELPQRRRWVTSIACGVLTTAVVIVVFQYVFLVRLP